MLYFLNIYIKILNLNKNKINNNKINYKMMLLNFNIKKKSEFLILELFN